MTDINLTIDGRKVSVAPGTTVLQAVATLGEEVPHYCYHPGLSIAGNCRMCLVLVEKMPKPVIACKTTVSEGMVVDTKSPAVKKLQANTMEFLLINHPLDCPTCDQAGECRLQDYYMRYDLNPSRFVEGKVEKDKMVDLGAGVMLDEERCIVCTRCVRFCNEVAGVPELMVQERGDHSMVATFPGSKMENPYAGCTVDVCPVGALTSKDFRYKKRAWFLTHTDSICQGCSRGCNIEVHHADDKVYRLKPRFNADINKWWMCDAGRASYKMVHENRRLRPLVLENGALAESTAEVAVRRVAQLLAGVAASEIAFVASALESNESIDAFVDWAHKKYGVLQVYYSKNDPENPYSDSILITADKNPNLAHIKKMGLRPANEISASVKMLVVQRDLSAADAAKVRLHNQRIAALFATNVTAIDDLCDVILPVTTFAEQDGHVTNLDGQVQKYSRAIRPRGEAREMKSYVR